MMESIPVGVFRGVLARKQREETERDRRNNIKCIKRARYKLTGLHTTPQKGEGQAEKEKTAV